MTSHQFQNNTFTTVLTGGNESNGGTDNGSGGTGLNTTPVNIDPLHPYYLQNSDHPGMILVTQPLTDLNYSQWKRSMMIALSAKLKLGFVDGTHLAPTLDSPYFTHWTRCNDMVISWLLNSVSIEIRNSVVYLPTAKSIWDDLSTRFTQSNIARLFQLRKDLAHLTQDTMNVSAYFTKFRTMMDELDNLITILKCTCKVCTCGASTQLISYEQTLKVT